MEATTFSLAGRLRTADKPIALYGMGDGADKVIAALEAIGRAPDFVFASDAFYRPGKIFHGMEVLTYDEVCRRCGDFIVLVCFASALDDIIANVRRIAALRETYIPDVDVICDGGAQFFTHEQLLLHADALDALRESLCDERSREVLGGVINFKLSGDIQYLDTSEDSAGDIWSLMRTKRYRAAADLGAYTGDSARDIISHCENIAQITAFEPDERTFRKLKAYSDEIAPSGITLRAINAAAWSCDTTLHFDSRGGRNSHIGGDNACDGTNAKTTRGDDITGAKPRIREVSARSLDSLGVPCDLLKLDVEGAEREALCGCARTIERCSPDIALSLYHRTRDLWELSQLLSELTGGGRRLYLRRPRYMPAWDLRLYSIGL
ncbi:MAG: FkbM family methyltransferase [Eubacteriales bacterium]